MTKAKNELPPDLLAYLRRRSLRTGRTLEQTLETIVRESMAYDDVLAQMATGKLSGKLDRDGHRLP